MIILLFMTEVISLTQLYMRLFVKYKIKKAKSLYENEKKKVSIIS